MKIFGCILLFCQLLCLDLSAQQNHFLFVQSETRQPFNVTLNRKVYSSTATGYLIIPKLASGQYDIEIGFGPNTFPEQHFTVEIKQKDVGFNLKNISDKGWGLFNLLTFNVTMSKEAAPSENVASTLQNKMPNSNIGEVQQRRTQTFQPEIGSDKKSDQEMGMTTAAPVQQKKKRQTKQ